MCQSGVCEGECNYETITQCPVIETNLAALFPEVSQAKNRVAEDTNALIAQLNADQKFMDTVRRK